MELYFIRHGKTAGNTEGRYIGITDQPLCEAGRLELLALWEGKRRAARPVYVSGLLRTRETAELLFPGCPVRVRTGFNEMDFGAFENKNYNELGGDPAYQAWIDSGGETAPPGGEERSDFFQRTRSAFEAAVSELLSEQADSAAFVVHGGSIMTLLSSYGGGGFYDWQAKNGRGYYAVLDGEAWKSGEKKLEKIRSIPVSYTHLAQADLILCLYNPSSKKRKDYLQKACDLVLEYRSPETVCGYVKNIGREGEEGHVLSLKELRDTEVDMFTTVWIGNSQTKNLNGKMVTPRGYRLPGSEE